MFKKLPLNLVIAVLLLVSGCTRYTEPASGVLEDLSTPESHKTSTVTEDFTEPKEPDIVEETTGPKATIEVTPEEIEAFFYMTKDEIIDHLGGEYRIVETGAEGTYEGYYFESHGLIFVFEYTGTVSCIEPQKSFAVNGARDGMTFSQIKACLGDTEIIESWWEAPVHTAYYLEYFIGKCKYRFTTVYDIDGPAFLTIYWGGGQREPADMKSNPFFFQDNVYKAAYTARFTFAGLDLPDTVDLLVTEIKRFGRGVLYELRIDCDENFSGRDCFGWDRLQLGYFYVQRDKILLLDRNGIIDEIENESDILEHSTVVCQEMEAEDTLSEGEKGWHEYILVDDGIREYHCYNTLAETGFYETFIWKEGTGLVAYKSGFGAEKDDIELQLITNQPFDPYHPGGYPDGWSNDADGDQSKCITLDDYYFGDFHIGMKWEDTIQYFPSGTYTEKEEEDGHVITKTLTFDFLVLTFVCIKEESESFTLSSFETSGERYVTARGLQVGDAVEKLLELYGMPAYVRDYIWHYTDEADEGMGFGYERFYVTVKSGIVQNYCIYQIL